MFGSSLNSVSCSSTGSSVTIELKLVRCYWLLGHYRDLRLSAISEQAADPPLVLRQEVAMGEGRPHDLML